MTTLVVSDKCIPCPVVKRIEVWSIGRPHIWCPESCVTAARCSYACLVHWKVKVASSLTLCMAATVWAARHHSNSPVCRVLSLSDCKYSLNPLSQTRIDWVGRYRIRWTFKLSCTCGNHRRIVTYKIFINKQLKHTNVTIRLALYIHCVPKKHVTTFLMISWCRTVRLQRFLAHLLPRV